ncbi:hypothetical protein GS429_06680 [Natronorubrum sp. JWXQ-INN-674]|uniref:Uncharacterized protein n=1 Tax=Natronorubrum halalkaliphilum TaxID=2691917 RepID=A0A6B0VKW5_9EURY|nr:hypothetical protein [Natronorubrum halalkaliphilum]MXV61755.1 hypothetical protein [Natronorubrum halalkaliphilum]
MAPPDRDRSTLENNRLAAAVVAGSILAVASAAVLYWSGRLEFLMPARGPAADAVPLYVMAVVVLLALVVWSWNRLFSWFD